MIVNRADRLGLAQLYQLRGRVGRRERQAYAWFLVPRQLSLTETATKRLEAMEEFEELGSGYRLAMRDLEIRGAGNVLGVEQHGHVAAVGFEMYCKMLKDAVEGLRGDETAELPQCTVEAPYECAVPDTYVEDPDERMMLYRRLARATKPETVESIARELEDRFGRAPQVVRNLLDLTTVKLFAALQGIALVQIREPASRRGASSAAASAAASGRAGGRLARLSARIGGGLGGAPEGPSEANFSFGPGRAFTPEQCGRLVETFGPRVLFKAGKSFGVTLQGDPEASLLQDARNLLQVAYFSININDLREKERGREAPSR
jgi:hypothetical protein